MSPSQAETLAKAATNDWPIRFAAHEGVTDLARRAAHELSLDLATTT